MGRRQGVSLNALSARQREILESENGPTWVAERLGISPGTVRSWRLAIGYARIKDGGGERCFFCDALIVSATGYREAGARGIYCNLKCSDRAAAKRAAARAAREALTHGR